MAHRIPGIGRGRCVDRCILYVFVPGSLYISPAERGLPQWHPFRRSMAAVSRRQDCAVLVTAKHCHGKESPHPLADRARSLARLCCWYFCLLPGRLSAIIASPFSHLHPIDRPRPTRGPSAVFKRGRRPVTNQSLLFCPAPILHLPRRSFVQQSLLCSRLSQCLLALGELREGERETVLLLAHRSFPYSPPRRNTKLGVGSNIEEREKNKKTRTVDVTLGKKKDQGG